MKKYIKFFIIILASAVIVPQAALAAWWNPFSWGMWNRVFHFQRAEQKQEQVVCTMEAKLCPDGSYVSRKGPKCEFDTCPQLITSWKTFTSNELKYSFKYPSNWKVIPNYVYSAAGAGGLVGYTITTSNSKTPPDNERIDIGGAQVDCQHLVSQDGTKMAKDALCKTNYPVYTFSTDKNVISVFNTIAGSISNF
jgi:hypothetical protein